PNNEGKSTFARMIAQNHLLAQMGSPVPVEQMAVTPLRVLPYQHPTDAPQDQSGLFKAEAKVLKRVMDRAKEDGKFTLVLMDEIMPGTIPEVRTDVEKIVLRELAKMGVLVVTCTHNWGTTELGESDPAHFKNFHVSKFHVKPGTVENLIPMYEAAA